MATYELTFEGCYYKEGSSDPWKGATYTAVIEADSPALAIMEALSGLREHGHITSEGGDADWTVFDAERELAIRVKPTVL